MSATSGRPQAFQRAVAEIVAAVEAGQRARGEFEP